MLSLENKYRFAFLAGVLLLFMSLFLDWFHLEAYKDGKQIANWSYNIFTEWSSTKKASGFNKEARPNNLQVPMAMNILFVTSIFISTPASKNVLGETRIKRIISHTNQKTIK